MQSIAKQVTLALTGSHKTVKSHGCLAATPAWEQKKGGINGVQNKALELRNAVHGYWYVPLKHKVCKLSCQSAASQRDSEPRFTRGKTSSCL